jgi:hypothetical protein
MPCPHLLQRSRLEEERAAVREHHLHVLLDRREAPRAHTLQEVAHLYQQAGVAVLE